VPETTAQRKAIEQQASQLYGTKEWNIQSGNMTWELCGKMNGLKEETPSPIPAG